MNAQRIVVAEENRVKGLIEHIAEDKKLFSEFMEAKDIVLFAQKHGVELNRDEKQVIQAMQKNIKEAVNKGIAEMSDKVSKISNSLQLCNGTCW